MPYIGEFLYLAILGDSLSQCDHTFIHEFQCHGPHRRVVLRSSGAMRGKCGITSPEVMQTRHLVLPIVLRTSSSRLIANLEICRRDIVVSIEGQNLIRLCSAWQGESSKEIGVAFSHQSLGRRRSLNKCPLVLVGSRRVPCRQGHFDRVPHMARLHFQGFMMFMISHHKSELWTN